jgi:UDP-glucose 4-epimerase
LAEVHGFTYTIIRAYNIFGERQSLTDPYRGVAAIFMNSLLHDKPFFIYGDGEQKRGFTYIKDIIPYIADCGFSPSAKNEIFNMGGQSVYSVNDLAKSILKASKKDLVPTYLPDRVQEVKIAFCDTTKAQKTLGIKEMTPLDVAIKNMWNWAKEKGPQKPKYLDFFELPSNKIPSNWIKPK